MDYDWNSPEETAAAVIKTADTITGEITRAYKTKSEDGPLYVVLGEDHFIPAHILTKIMVHDNLKKAGYRLAVGIEQSHDILKRSFDFYKSSCGLTHISHSLDNVPEEKLSLENQIGYWNLRVANSTKKSFFRFLLQEDICTSFSDLAKKADYLDYQDPVTRKIIDSVNEAAQPQSITSSSPLGMYVRNLFTFENARKSAARENPDIYIQNAGNIHVAGEIMPGWEECSYERSLTGLFESAGCNVVGIPVYCAENEKDLLPVEAQQSPFVSGHIYLPGVELAEDFDDRRWLRNIWKNLPLDQDLARDMNRFASACKKNSDRVFRAACRQGEPAELGALVPVTV